MTLLRSQFARSLWSASRKPLRRGKHSRLQLLLEQLEDRTLLNAAPIVDIGSNLQVDEGEWFNLNGSFSDEDGFGVYNGEVNWGDSPFPTPFWRPDPGSFSVAHAYADDGSYQVVANLTDAGGATGTDAIQVDVDNVAPTFSGLEITSPVTEGGAAVLHGFVTDPGWGDEITVTINWGDGSEPTVLEWPAGGTHEFSASHVDVDDDPTGTPGDDYTVHLTASDDDGGSTSVNMNVRVNNVAPTISSLSASGAAENDFLTLSGSIADPGVEDTFTVTVDWGDGSPPDVFTAGLGAFERTHRYLDDDPSGTSSDNYSISVVVSDDDTGTDNDSVTTTVHNVSPIVTAVTVSEAEIDEGDTVTVGGAFKDPGTLDTHTVLVDWGDGDSSSISLPQGARTFSGLSHKYRDDGPSPGNGASEDTYTITVTITDDDTGAGVGSASLIVKNVDPQLAELTVTSPIDENESATLSGRITDVGELDEHWLHISWGDGTSESHHYGPGDVEFSWSHQYLDDDPSGTASDVYPITITLVDDDSGSVGATRSVTVRNVDPTLTASVTSPINENGVATLTGTISDPGTRDTFTLVIDWDDGSAPETYYFGSGAQSFSLTHQYLDDGPYPGNGTPSDNYQIQVTLTDDDTGSDSVTSSLTVNNVAPSGLSLTLTPNPLDENEWVDLSGSFVDPGTKDAHTVTVNWGDGSPDTVLQLSAGVLSFGGLQHQYLDDNPTATPQDVYPITVTVTDDDTGTSASSQNLTVRNVAPTVNSVTLSPNPLDENGIVSVGANFTDPGTLDTFTVTINWGDGSSPLVFSLGAGERSFSGKQHQYLDDDPTNTPSDNYTITVTVVDDDTGAGSESATLTVQDVAPEVTEAVLPDEVDEDGTITISGSFTDPGTLDTHTVLLQLDGATVASMSVPLGARSFSGLSYKFLDDGPYPGNGTPADVAALTVKVVDDDTLAGDWYSSITVNNVEPALEGVDVTSPAWVETLITATGTIVDPGTKDGFALIIDWGDGAVDTYHYGPGTTAFEEFHVYAATGTYTVSFFLEDDDTGSDFTSVEVIVTEPPIHWIIDPKRRTSDPEVGASLAQIGNVEVQFPIKPDTGPCNCSCGCHPPSEVRYMSRTTF